MKIDANKFKESLSIIGLAVSKDMTDRPITRTVELSTNNGALWGYSCDKLNNIQLKICDTTENFSIVVDFATLFDIIKHCDDDVDITIKNNNLVIKTSTMSCKIPSRITTDSTTMPRPIYEEDKEQEIDFEKINDIIPLCKSIIDTNIVVNAYRNICFNENIMVSDTNNVAIVRENIFGMEDGEYTQFILRQSSVNILNILENCYYHTSEHKIPTTNKTCKFLHIRNEDKTMYINIIPDTTSYEYQYNELMDLFNINMQNSVIIEHDILSKAYSLSKLFIGSPILEFNNNGVTLKVEQSDFNYNLTDFPCDSYTYKVTDDIIKKILTIKGSIKVYYDDNPFLKCISGNIEQIIGVEVV